MWKNFKDMPFFMKLLVFHGLMFFIGGITSLFPIFSFSVDGNEVTYSDWWLLGAGIKFFIVSVSLGGCAICLLKKEKYARIFYLGVLICILFTDSTLLKRIDGVLINVIFVALFYWYLFWKRSVRLYFEASST